MKGQNKKKKKTEKLYLIKIKTFVFQGLLPREKVTHRMRENVCKSCLLKD